MIVGPPALEERRIKTAEAQRDSAESRVKWLKRWSCYHNLLRRALAFFVEPGGKVLSVRCQTGWMLDAVRPAEGVGLDLTEEMVAVAKRLHPDFRYEIGFPDTHRVDGKFDSIIVADTGETVDLQEEFELLRECCHSGTRLYVCVYNASWEWAFLLAERMGLKMSQPEQNWLTEFDLRGFLELSGFELVKIHRLGLFPFGLPVLSWFFNSVVAALPGIRRLCLLSVLVAKPAGGAPKNEEMSVSVIVPCRNEEGNIESAVERIPQLGSQTEIIFCDDKSTDKTRAEIERMIAKHADKDIRLVDGPGLCKSKNVWAGFDAAKNDLLMILDADLTVMPEELPRFLAAISTNKGEFINGSRLVYPIPREAMKFTNRVGNVVFSWLFSLLLGQRIKDTLCGTKVLRRSDWVRMRKYVDFWGVSDRWGDYDLLLGAAKLNLRIVDLPIHYQERVAGISKMTKVLHNAKIMLSIMWKASGKMRNYGS